MALAFIPPKSTTTFGRSWEGSDVHHHLLITSKLKDNRLFLPKQNLWLFSSDLRLENGNRLGKREVAVYFSAKPESKLPADSGRASILKTTLAIFLALKDKVEPIIKKMETAAKVVEVVAGILEEVAKNVASWMPSGRLQEAALLLQKVFKGLRMGAHIAEGELEEAGEVEEKMESFLVSTTHQGNTVTTTETKD